MKIRPISGKDFVKFLNERGFEIVGRKGSHIRLKKETSPCNLITIVPDHKELAQGTLRSIPRQANIDFNELVEHFTC